MTRTFRILRPLALAAFATAILLLGACHRGGKPQWSDEKAAFFAPSGLKGLSLAGAAAGIDGLAACLEDGAAKGTALAESLGYGSTKPSFGAVVGEIAPAPAKPMPRPNMPTMAVTAMKTTSYHWALSISICGL